MGVVIGGCGGQSIANYCKLTNNIAITCVTLIDAVFDEGSIVRSFVGKFCSRCRRIDNVDGRCNGVRIAGRMCS